MRQRCLSVLGESSVTLGDENVSYTIKRSAVSRRVRIELRPETGVSVIIPRGYDTSTIPDLLKAKQKWILSKLVKLAQLQTFPTTSSYMGIVPYLGKDLRLEVLNNQTRDYVEIKGDTLLVCSSSDNGSVTPCIKIWYRSQSERIIRDTTHRISNLLGISYQRLTIRGQRTRWASCSRRGNLSFNWKLVLVPEPVIEYVVIHELLHLKEMNHSKRFWNLVAEHCPEWRRHREWLKGHETQLSVY